MRLCSLYGPVRSLALALMNDTTNDISYPGKKAVLLSEIEYDTLKEVLLLAKKTSTSFCDGTYEVLYQDDKDDVYQEQFVTEILYQDILRPMVFDLGQGQKGYVVMIDKQYAYIFSLLVQMYGHFIGRITSEGQREVMWHE